MLKQILDIFYALIGVLMLLAGIESLRDKASKTHIGTGIFWLILAAIFLIGNYLPNEIIGILIVIIGGCFTYLFLNQSHISYIDNSQVMIGLGFALITIILLSLHRYQLPRLSYSRCVVLLILDVNPNVYVS